MTAYQYQPNYSTKFCEFFLRFTLITHNYKFHKDLKDHISIYSFLLFPKTTFNASNDSIYILSLDFKTFHLYQVRNQI